MMMSLTLKIVTPAGVVGPIECDSVHLTLSEDLKGNKGGAYGIRAGHTKALLSLGEGPLEALLAEKTLLKGAHLAGFATIDQNEVKVVVEGFEKE